MAEQKEVTGKDIPTEQSIFNAAWAFLKMFYYIRQDSPEKEWARCTKCFSQLFRIGNDEATEALSQGVATAVFKYLEIRSKEGERNNGNNR